MRFTWPTDKTPQKQAPIKEIGRSFFRVSNKPFYEIIAFANKEVKRPEDKERYAIKVLSIEKILEEQKHVVSLKNEISIMWDMIRCSAALQLIEMYIDSLNVYLVLEFQEKGSLLSQIISLPQKENDDGSQSRYQRPLNENQTKLIMT